MMHSPLGPCEGVNRLAYSTPVGPCLSSAETEGAAATSEAAKAASLSEVERSMARGRGRGRVRTEAGAEAGAGRRKIGRGEGRCDVEEEEEARGVSVPLKADELAPHRAAGRLVRSKSEEEEARGVCLCRVRPGPVWVGRSIASCGSVGEQRRGLWPRSHRRSKVNLVTADLARCRPQVQQQKMRRPTETAARRRARGARE